MKIKIHKTIILPLGLYDLLGSRLFELQVGLWCYIINERPIELNFSQLYWMGLRWSLGVKVIFIFNWNLLSVFWNIISKKLLLFFMSCSSCVASCVNELKRINNLIFIDTYNLHMADVTESRLFYLIVCGVALILKLLLFPLIFTILSDVLWFSHYFAIFTI